MTTLKRPKIAVAIALSSMFFIGCIQPKKFYTEFGIRQACEEREMQLLSEVKNMNRQLGDRNATVNQLQKELTSAAEQAETREAQLEALNQRIAATKTAAQSTTQELNTSLEQKTQQLTIVQGQLNEIKSVIEVRENGLAAIEKDIRSALQNAKQTVEMQQKPDGLVITLSEKLLFGAVYGMDPSKNGDKTLQAICEIINKHPSLDVSVVGHADNQPASRKKWGDNWDFSLKRASTIAKALIDDFYVNANQVLPIARAEYYPATSNETKEGQEANRRVEIVLQYKQRDLTQKIKKNLDLE